MWRKIRECKRVERGTNMGRHGRDRKEQKRDQERAYSSMQSKASEKALATFHHKPFYCMEEKKNENRK